MTPKEYVDSIHADKAKNDSNSRDLARTLNVLSKTVFGDVNRFVFELLQNADDSSLGNDQNIEVEFKLLNNYLTFSHNGAHFTATDVTGISSIGSKKSQKDKSIEKTGYKGIGFKSVFGSSDYVHIMSNEYSFRFDRNFEGWHDADEYPWQVIPIWTDKPDAEIAGTFKQDWVNTFIAIKNRDAIKKEVVKVFKDCQILLFLRKVVSITFYDFDKIDFQISKNTTCESIIGLYNNGKAVSSWITKSFDLVISDDLRAKLNNLSDTECPQKLKDALSTKLTFAASVWDNFILPLKSAVIYSYLPTKADKGLPYLANGDFLTNAERTDLLPNIWNEFLFQEIAIRQLEWFEDLQSTVFKFEILKLLKGKYTAYEVSDIELSFNLSLDRGMKSNAFLAEQDNDFYSITPFNSVIDVPHLSEYFQPSLITEYLGIADSHGIIDLRVVNQTALSGLGPKQFTFNQIFDIIAAGSMPGSLDAINLVAFFFNRTLDKKNSTWLGILSDQQFLMDQSGQYKTPKEIFMPLQNSSEQHEIEFENLSFVHSDILNHFQDYPDVTVWLKNLGVREPTGLEIVKKAILPLIANNQVTEGNVFNITSLVFKVFKLRLLQDKDYDSLKALKVSTSNGLKKAGEAYLSDVYKPDKNLSNIIPLANFLAIDYIDDDEDISLWKEFFKKIGVRENISIEVNESKIERQTFIINHPSSGAYFTWLENNVHFPKIYHQYRGSGQHYIQNFTAIDFSSHLNSVEFSKFFWGKMLQNWEEFKAMCSKTKYYYYGGSNNVPSFVEYYVKNFPSIPCTDGICYISTSVYVPSLKSVIGSYFPVADLSSSLTVEQAKFFEFKRTISVTECLSLLDKISLQIVTADLTRQVFSIYDQLIGHSGENDSIVQGVILKWRDIGSLLTLNNSFQPADAIYCFSVRGTEPPMNSERFLKLPNNLSFDEKQALCDLLNISTISYEMLEFVAQVAVIELGLQRTLLRKLKFLSLIHSHNSNEDFVKVYSRLRTIISTTSFYQAESLNLIYKGENSEIIFDQKIESWNDKSQNFYFAGKWNSPLTLYGLAGSLCGLLALKDMERDFELIMRLNDDDTSEWLLQKGYNFSNDLLSSINLDIYVVSDTEIDLQAHSEFDGIDIALTSTFEPVVQVSEISFSGLQPEIKDFTNGAPIIHKQYERLTDKQLMVDVGRWSEEYIDRYLNGNPERFTEINWLNKDGESHLPYDFIVVENGVSKVFEVKGTSSLDKDEIYMSPAEWEVLFDQGADYSFFRVYGAGTDDHRFVRIDDLRHLIEKGKILPSPIALIV